MIYYKTSIVKINKCELYFYLNKIYIIIYKKNIVKYYSNNRYFVSLSKLDSSHVTFCQIYSTNSDKIIYLDYTFYKSSCQLIYYVIHNKLIILFHFYSISLY